METKKTSLQKVLSIIDKNGHATENITLETSLENYIDSLDQVEIVLEIEKELNTHIADDEVEKWKTIGDIVSTYELFSNNKNK